MKRPIDPALAARVPPGQVLTQKWPVLTYGLTPRAMFSKSMNIASLRSPFNPPPLLPAHPPERAWVHYMTVVRPRRAGL